MRDADNKYRTARRTPRSERHRYRMDRFEYRTPAINTGRGRTYTKRKGILDRNCIKVQDGKDDIQDGEAMLQYGEVQI